MSRCRMENVLIATLGLGLNQAEVVLGANLSFADIFLVLLLIYLLIKGELWIPTVPFVFYLVLFGWMSMASLFVMQPPIGDGTITLKVFIGLLKLTICFLFCVVAMNVVRRGLGWTMFRGFYSGAVLVSVFSIPQIIGFGSLVPSIFYKVGSRFSGLTDDPNYFAVMMACALALVWSDNRVAIRTRFLMSAPLVSGILASGSKTGLLTLLVVLGWFVVGIDRYGRSRNRISLQIAATTLVAVVFILTVVFFDSFLEAISTVSKQVPALDRISTLATDFDSAVSEDGSSRNIAWQTGILVVASHPLMGIGSGTYELVGQYLNAYGSLAHNTYLQIAAEWGLPLCCLFFVWVCIGFIGPMARAHMSSFQTASTRALIALAVGSMGVSLNNARLLWVVIGCGCVWLCIQQGNSVKTTANVEKKLMRKRPSSLSHDDSLAASARS